MLAAFRSPTTTDTNATKAAGPILSSAIPLITWPKKSRRTMNASTWITSAMSAQMSMSSRLTLCAMALTSGQANP